MWGFDYVANIGEFLAGILYLNYVNLPKHDDIAVVPVHLLSNRLSTNKIIKAYVFDPVL